MIAVILRCEHLRASKDDGVTRILRDSPQARLAPQDDASASQTTKGRPAFAAATR